MLLARIKKEIGSFSRWFTAVLVGIFVLYVSLWFFTIHISALQQTQHITPTLPVVAEDSAEYADLAQSLIQGNVFSMNGQFETLRTPGYPLFVAAIKTIGGSYFAVTFVQIFITLLSAFVIRRIGMRFASQKVGEIAAMLFLINPVTLTLTLLIYSDILFLLLFTLGFYRALILEETGLLKQILLVSILFALAIYVRPIGLLAIPIFIAPIIASSLASKLKWKAVGILLVCIALLIAPWMVRNYLRTGVFSFTSIQASSIGWATARFLANTDHLPLEAAYQTLTERIGTPESGWRDIRLSQKITSVSEEIILARPFAYAKYHLTMALSFLFPSTIAFALDLYHDSIGHSPPFSLEQSTVSPQATCMLFTKELRGCGGRYSRDSCGSAFASSLSMRCGDAGESRSLGRSCLLSPILWHLPGRLQGLATRYKHCHSSSSSLPQVLLTSLGNTITSVLRNSSRAASPSPTSCYRA